VGVAHGDEVPHDRGAQTVGAEPLRCIHEAHLGRPCGGERNLGVADGEPAGREGAVAEVQLLTPTGRRPRVDLYVKGEAIISRKFPMGQLAEDELKALDYLQELYVKYPRKAPIRTAALAGEELQGVHVLQVPVQYMPLPKRVLEYARDRRIFIVDIEGKFYNPLLSVPD